MLHAIHDEKAVLNPHIEKLIDVLNELENYNDSQSTYERNLSYIFSTLLDKVYSHASYHGINNAIKVLATVQAEFYRRVSSLYEENKKH